MLNTIVASRYCIAGSFQPLLISRVYSHVSAKVLACYAHYVISLTFRESFLHEMLLPTDPRKFSTHNNTFHSISSRDVSHIGMVHIHCNSKEESSDLTKGRWDSQLTLNLTVKVSSMGAIVYC